MARLKRSDWHGFRINTRMACLQLQMGGETEALRQSALPSSVIDYVGQYGDAGAGGTVQDGEPALGGRSSLQQHHCASRIAAQFRFADQG